MSLELEMVEEFSSELMKRVNDFREPLSPEIIQDYVEKTALADLLREELPLPDDDKVWEICIKLVAFGMEKGEMRTLKYVLKLLASKIDEMVAKEEDKV